MKFRGDSFIGCQDIRENAVHWFKLEVLPKSGFQGINGGGGGGWHLERNDALGIYLIPKHVLWYIERQATLYGPFRRAQETT